MSFLREPNVSAPDPLHAPETGPAHFLLPAWHAPAPVHAPSSLVPFLIYQSHPLKYPQGWAAGLLYSLLSSSFAFLVTRRLPPSLPRLLACAPWLACNALLPWVFDPATHGVGVAVLFCIVTWLHSFKLLALCWNRGVLVRPLVRDNALLFFAALSFPIHISLREGKRGGKGKEVREERGGVASPPPVPSDAVGAKKQPSPHAAKPWEAESWSELLVQSAVKTVLLTLLMRVYFWHDSLPSIAVHALHTLCLFLFVTVVCEMLAGVTGVVAEHIEFEPHFRHPYFADSFADFWARRWNLTVSTLLRDCVYDPILDALLPASPPPTQGPMAARLGQVGNAGQKATSSDGDGDAVARRTPSPPSGLGWARLVAMMATFLVSGLAHEIVVFYLTFTVTGEMTAFFVLHGVLTALEHSLRKRRPASSDDEARGPRKDKSTAPDGVVQRRTSPLAWVAWAEWASVPFVVGITFLTGHWLFFGPLTRLGVGRRIVRELQGAVGLLGIEA